MQQLTAAPRSSLTAQQVTSLLLGDSLTVTAGAERLNSSLVVQEDISNDLLAGSIERVMGATVHGTCKLEISRVLAWGTDLVRPYMILSNGTVTARFNLGVFTLTTPERPVGLTPETYSCAGYDRLYLLNRPVGDTYIVTAGTSYLAAVQNVVSAAGLSGVYLDSTAQGKTLPTDMVWPLKPAQGQAGSTSWLNVINDLLSAISYRGLWADENGLFRSEPYVTPSARAPEFTFTTDAATIVGQDRTFTQDIWNVPNRWVFVQQNLTAAPADGAGQYTVNNVSNGLTSQNSRGLVWPKVVELAAADQASLQAQGDVIAAADQQVAAELKVTLGPFPAAGHWDVYAYSDSAISVSKVVCTQWQLDLSGADMNVIWRVVA